MLWQLCGVRRSAWIRTILDARLACGARCHRYTLIVHLYASRMQDHAMCSILVRVTVQASSISDHGLQHHVSYLTCSLNCPHATAGERDSTCVKQRMCRCDRITYAYSRRVHSHLVTATIDVGMTMRRSVMRKEFSRCGDSTDCFMPTSACTLCIYKLAYGIVVRLSPLWGHTTCFKHSALLTAMHLLTA
eukprot:16368-Heterococcus_DN1.PRE.2